MEQNLWCRRVTHSKIFPFAEFMQGETESMNGSDGKVLPTRGRARR